MDTNYWFKVASLRAFSTNYLTAVPVIWSFLSNRFPPTNSLCIQKFEKVYFGERYKVPQPLGYRECLRRQCWQGVQVRPKRTRHRDVNPLEARRNQWPEDSTTRTAGYICIIQVIVVSQLRIILGCFIAVWPRRWRRRKWPIG